MNSVLIGLDNFILGALTLIQHAWKVAVGVLQPVAVTLLVIDVIVLGYKTAFGGTKELLKKVITKFLMGWLVIFFLMPRMMIIGGEILDFSTNIVSSIMAGVLKDPEVSQSASALVEKIAKSTGDGAAELTASQKRSAEEAIKFYTQDLSNPAPFSAEGIWAYGSTLLGPVKPQVLDKWLFDSSLIIAFMWLISWLLIVGIIFVAIGVLLEFWIIIFLIGVTLPFTMLEGVTGGVKFMIKPLFNIMIKVFTYLVVFLIFFSLISTTTSAFFKDENSVNFTVEYLNKEQDLREQNKMLAAKFDETYLKELQKANRNHTWYDFDKVLNIALQNMEKEGQQGNYGDQYKSQRANYYKQIADSITYTGTFKYKGLNPSLFLCLMFLLAFIFLSKSQTFANHIIGGMSDFNGGKEAMNAGTRVARTAMMAGALGFKAVSAMPFTPMAAQGMGARTVQGGLKGVGALAGGAFRGIRTHGQQFRDPAKKAEKMEAKMEAAAKSAELVRKHIG